MKPDVLMIDPDITSFAIADRRLRDHFSLLWAPTIEAAMSALRKFELDAALVRADDLEAIRRLHEECPDLPLVAVAPWESQGDEACSAGASEWVSAPINFARLAAVLDFVVVRSKRADEPGSGGFEHRAAAPG